MGLKGAPGISGGRSPEGKAGVDGGITARPLRGEEGGDRDDEWDPLVSGGASESGRRAGASGVWDAGAGWWGQARSGGGRRGRERAG